MSETLTAIRQKHPAYDKVPDDKLVEAIGSKYPQYLERDANFQAEFDQAKANRAGRQQALRTELAGEQKHARITEGVQEVAGQIEQGAEALSRPVSTFFNGLGAIGHVLKGVALDAWNQIRNPATDTGVTTMGLANTKAALTKPVRYEEVPVGPAVLGINLRMARFEPALPAESAQEPLAEQIVGGAAEMAPQIAAMMAAPELGVSEKLAPALIMGGTTYAQTGDAERAAKSAALGMALPVVNEFAGKAAATGMAALVKSGVKGADSPILQKTVESTAQQVAMNTLFVAADAPQYLEAFKKDPEKAKQDLAQTIGVNLALGLPGLAGIPNAKVPSETQALLVRQARELVERFHGALEELSGARETVKRGVGEAEKLKEKGGEQNAITEGREQGGVSAERAGDDPGGARAQAGAGGGVSAEEAVGKGAQREDTIPKVEGRSENEEGERGSAEGTAARTSQRDVPTTEGEHPNLTVIRNARPGSGKEVIMAAAGLDPARPQDLVELTRMRDEARAAANEARAAFKAESSPSKRKVLMGEFTIKQQRASDLREAVEAATGTGGSAVKAKEFDPNYRAPFQQTTKAPSALRIAAMGVSSPGKIGVKTSAERRAELVKQHEDAWWKAHKANEAQVDHQMEDDFEYWQVTSNAKGNDASAMVTKTNDEQYEARDENDSRLHKGTLEDAIQTAKDHVEGSDNQEQFEVDLSARQEILHTLELPSDMELIDEQDSKWGSYYYKVRKVLSRDADGEPEQTEEYKISIRNHEPSPFREKEFGAVDYWVEVPKQPTYQQLADAVGKVEQWLKKRSDTQPPQPPPRKAAMGAAAPGNRPKSARARVTRAERDQTALRAREQEAANPRLKAAGVELSRRATWFRGVRSTFAPQTLDESGGIMAGIMRSLLGREWQLNMQADAALREFRREFDRTPVARGWVWDEAASRGVGEPVNTALPRNYEVMRAIDTGDVSRLTPVEQRFAQGMRKLFDEAIEAVQQVSPGSLRDLIENYFPRIWQEPDASQKAEGRMQKLGHKPWEGPRSFLKQRVLEYFEDGLKAGLKPVSDNPVDITLAKLGEMYRFVAARSMMAEAKARGLRKFVYIYEKAPDGWVQVDDPSSSVFAPPTVTVKEAYDAQLRAKTLEMLEALGVPQERLTRLGGKRWGTATEGEGIKTKFGGPDFVFWHEVGHQIDWRFPDLRRTFSTGGRAKAMQEQLRALADLRFEGENPGKTFRKYVRRTEEKMANLFHAYLHAPEKFRSTAPDVWAAFNGWLDAHPEVKGPINEIKPSLRLGSGSTEMFVGGPVLLGRWMMPDGAGQVVSNYLQPGLGKYAAFRKVREISGLLNGIQLAGFFHGQFVLNDALYSALGLAAYDVAKGRPVRGLKELWRSNPVSVAVAGHRVLREIRTKAEGRSENAERGSYQDIARLAVEANLRAGHSQYDAAFGRRWVKAIREFRSAPSAGAAWDVFTKAPLALVETSLKPIMDGLVPRMKMGIFSRMAERIIEDNLEIDQDGLRRKLAEAANATEDRLGQVTYDNLKQARTVKDLGQLALRAYGWQLTKYRMMGGGALDWVRAGGAVMRGQRPEVTFRMTYLPAMVAGHALMGATIMYLLTGRRPQELRDYLFPQTGLKDERGNVIRVSIADFVKDIVADWRSFPSISKMGSEWSRKLAPFWNMAAEMYRNEDFYGTKIFSDRLAGEPYLQHLQKTLGEGAAFLSKEALPFSTHAGKRYVEAGLSPGKAALAGLLGYNPAPRQVTQSPAEARAEELMQAQLPRGGRSQESATHAQVFGEVVKNIARGKTNSAGQLQAAIRGRPDVAQLKERLNYTPLQYQVHAMDLDGAMEVWDLANGAEREQLEGILGAKIAAAGKSGKVPQERLTRYNNIILEYERNKATKARGTNAAAGGGRYSAFGN